MEARVGEGPLLLLGTHFPWRLRAGTVRCDVRVQLGGHSGTRAGKIWLGAASGGQHQRAAGQSQSKACRHLKGTRRGRGGGGRAVGAGLPANSLKCVGERGKEERISSQQPRHLVEGPSEDTDQITNTQPGQRARAQEGRPGQELQQTIAVAAPARSSACWPLRHCLAPGP